MDHRVKRFLEFKKLNESLFLFVDRSPKSCYITKADYDAKLGNLFKNEKFTLIENFVIEKELVDFRKLLRETIGKNVSNIKLLNLNPQNSISEAYGQIKLHKPGYPLRPIVPGHSSLTNNVEKYLKLILTPLLKNVHIKSTRPKNSKKNFWSKKSNLIQIIMNFLVSISINYIPRLMSIEL